MKRILFVLLAITMVFGLCACGGNTEESKAVSEPDVSKTESKAESVEASKEESVPTALPEFTVTVVDEEGNPVAGAQIQICDSSNICFMPANSDSEGKAVIKNIVVENGYTLKVPVVPAGYEYKGEAEVALEAGSTEYTVELSKVAE